MLDVSERDPVKVAVLLDEMGEQGWKLITVVTIEVPGEYLGGGVQASSTQEQRYVFRRVVVEGRE